jgi:dTDP-4-dehydrorhamnose 3,5-epimerase
MNFKFSYTPIEGLVVIEPTVYGDDRGYFMECFRESDYAEAGITTRFVQENESMSARAVLRGLHFQRTEPQAKLVRVVSGALLDVAVDLREGSATYGKWHAERLSAKNRRQMFIPEGFAHGFLALENDTRLNYKCSRYYAPQDEDGIAWNDPTLAIDWQLERWGIEPSQLIISDKDSKWPNL